MKNKEIRDITVKVSDLRSKVEELLKDNIQYVELTIFDEEEFDGMLIPKTLNFCGFDGEGGGIDFEDIEHIEVDPFYNCCNNDCIVLVDGRETTVNEIDMMPDIFYCCNDVNDE